MEGGEGEVVVCCSEVDTDVTPVRCLAPVPHLPSPLSLSAPTSGRCPALKNIRHKVRPTKYHTQILKNQGLIENVSLERLSAICRDSVVFCVICDFTPYVKV